MPSSPAPSLEDLRARYGVRYKWLALFTVMVGTMASFMSSTIVNVAVPEMSRHFALGQDRAQWIAAAFMVAMLPGLSVTPWLLARFGLRRTYSAAALLLMVGGLVGGLSNHFNLLILMRAAEGFASGILQPIPSIVILRAFPKNEQGRAMGVYGLGVVLAPAAGPAVGGVLIEQFGWRSIFFVVIPFGLAALALARAWLPRSSAFVQEKKPLDWLGLAWISAATIALLNGLSELRRADQPGTWLLLALGVGGLAGFALYQLRKPTPLLQMRLFAHRAFSMGAAASFILGFGVFGSTYLLPVFLQMALGYLPSQAGLALLPGGIALALSMPVAGRMADSVPAAPLIIAGALLLSASTALMAPVTPETRYALIVGWIVLGRVGIALILPALTLGSTRGLAANELAQAMSMSSFTRQLGGAIGVSTMGILLDWRLAAHGVDESAGPVPGMLAAFSESFLGLAAVCSLAAVAAAFMKDARR